MVSMSARVGSISDNDIGGWYSYRASKSALNQLNRCMVCGITSQSGACQIEVLQMQPEKAEAHQLLMTPVANLVVACGPFAPFYVT